jgi:peptidoglycan hydrolase CwlO-like protein
MKEEMVALHDRNRSLKADLQRKETQVNTLREQVATKGKDAAATKEFVQQLDRLKEDKKRLKLELDICQ